MNKKFSTVMIAIWGVIALVLIGILVFFIICGHNFNMSNWNFRFNGSNSAQTQYVNKSFTVSDLSEINVDAKSADVSFSKTQGDEVKVSITGSGNSNNKDMYTVSQSGGVLQITQEYNWGFSFFFFGPYNQRISITLPESYKKDLALKLTSGDITFNGDYTFGKADIYKTSGDLVAGSIKADTFTLKTTSGDTSISKLNASYEIHSTSGDMKFDSLEGYGSIGSISGNIECNISKLSGAFGVTATSGNIDIGLSQNVGADIKADTTSGNVNANFAMSYSGSGRNHATANVGSSPYNMVSVSVTSGNVNITQN